MEKKKPPHTEYEKHLLIELVQPHVSVLDSRRTDGVTVKKKNEAWEKLTVEFNSSRNITQTVTSKQLKKMWQNLKTKARDAKTIANQANRTGRGPQPPQIGAIESQVLAVIPNVMPTIAVDIDSDVMYVEDHETEADDDSSAWLSKKNRVTELEIQATQSFNPIPQPAASSPEPSSSRVQPIQPPQASNRGSNKRKERNEEEESLDGLRKKIYLRELQIMEEKLELEKKLLLEKHKKEMEILDIKKEIALKELNK